MHENARDSAVGPDAVRTGGGGARWDDGGIYVWKFLKCVDLVLFLEIQGWTRKINSWVIKNTKKHNRIKWAYGKCRSFPYSNLTLAK